MASKNPLPVRRDLHFNIDGGKIKNWHPMGRQVSHIASSLFVFFPVGERFFIHSVRHYRDRITDPEQRKAVAGFIGQEAMHGREHEHYNELLIAAGLPAARQEQQVNTLLEFLKRNLPPKMQLSVTIALEHFTAILGDVVLKDPRIPASADPAINAMIRWHALEETEHKAVAFDVYRVVAGKGLGAYATRATGLLAATAVLLTLSAYYHTQFTKADPASRNWRERLRLLNFMFGSPGVYRRMAGPWLDYFRPGFHPWDHDNRHFLKDLDTLTAEIKAATPIAA
ncbi:MAG: metal-dependent hydrolase [Stenotrophobium sp.]